MLLCRASAYQQCWQLNKYLSCKGLARTPSRRLSTDLLEELQTRGFIQDVTRPQELQSALRSKQQAVYAGVDPTAKSLHIGHLFPLMCLLHFQVRGHRIIPLIGGATGLIGDPSGRLVERQLADRKEVEANVVSLSASLDKFFQHALLYAKSRVKEDLNDVQPPSITSNLIWHKSISMLDFLRTVGVHARINTMLNRESVRARLSSQQGLSFTEFTYQLLQAYDFYHLNRSHGCTIQIGGSDQWGNILAGLELISRSNPDQDAGNKPPEAFGITTPLLTTASGDKFGKSAGNAIWLDPILTSVFDFYQYFIRVADADVERYLNLFTLAPEDVIQEIMAEHNKQPEKRIAQRKLAAEVTELVHQTSGVERAEALSQLLFAADYSDLRAARLVSALEGDPRLVMLSPEEMFEFPIPKLAAKHGLVSSNSAARNLVVSRGLYLNNHPVQDATSKLDVHDLVDNRIAVIRAGKEKLLVLALNVQ
ncbi:tyrosyl-tRNA synthetase [Pluteus cervinus]|uniref:Tyrosyl-tRNA synthetase n=1 Tax=Pluteus cervinus TaxID=181527 RepID=A0ACD3BBJ9_9AGAR|nr:tyrosyl-tRNA synthetase [Pluteus cervinus]